MILKILLFLKQDMCQVSHPREVECSMMISYVTAQHALKLNVFVFWGFFFLNKQSHQGFPWTSSDIQYTYIINSIKVVSVLYLGLDLLYA